MPDLSTRLLYRLSGAPLSTALEWSTPEAFRELVRTGVLALSGHLIRDVSVGDSPEEYGPIPSWFIPGAEFDFEGCTLSNSGWSWLPEGVDPLQRYVGVNYDYQAAEKLDASALGVSALLPLKKARGAPQLYPWIEIMEHAREIFEAHPTQSQNALIKAVVDDTFRRYGKRPGNATVGGYVRKWLSFWKSAQG